MIIKHLNYRIQVKRFSLQSLLRLKVLPCQFSVAVFHVLRVIAHLEECDNLLFSDNDLLPSPINQLTVLGKTGNHE